MSHALIESLTYLVSRYFPVLEAQTPKVLIVADEQTGVALGSLVAALSQDHCLAEAVVLRAPHEWPSLGPGPYDLIVVAQVLEFADDFTEALRAIVSVAATGAVVIVAAPSRIVPNRDEAQQFSFSNRAFDLLATQIDWVLVERWTDQRGPSRNVLGVFADRDMAVPSQETRLLVAPAPVEVPEGSAAENATAGKSLYLDLMDELHRELQPDFYLEIGVRIGNSLSLARGAAIGIDPEPDVPIGKLGNQAEIIELGSDEYFRTIDPSSARRPDMAFIDGMHLFEFALRDFMNIELISNPNSLAVIDDIFPSHPKQATRERQTRVWTGDVWKLHEILVEFRPDLKLIPVDTQPTGLLLIAAMDSKNTVLWDNYDSIVERYAREMAPPRASLEREGAVWAGAADIKHLVSVLSSAAAEDLSVVEVRRRINQAPQRIVVWKQGLRGMLPAMGELGRRARR